MKIKMFVMDVDGTLTDGRIYIGAEGEVMKAFDVKDGYGIVRLRDYGIEPVIITGRQSKIVEARAKELQIKELHQGVLNKYQKMLEVALKYGVSTAEIAYIGDDINDLECIQGCCISACPGDAVVSIQEKVSYCCEQFGGRGAVREFIDYLLQYYQGEMIQN